jgi:hypothetical protein
VGGAHSGDESPSPVSLNEMPLHISAHTHTERSPLCTPLRLNIVVVFLSLQSRARALEGLLREGWGRTMQQGRRRARFPEVGHLGRSTPRGLGKCACLYPTSFTCFVAAHITLVPWLCLTVGTSMDGMSAQKKTDEHPKEGSRKEVPKVIVPLKPWTQSFSSFTV